MDNGRVMVVTGASSGIGRALALEASHHGWRLLLVARREDRLGETQRLIRQSGGTAEMLVGDVTDPATPHHIVETAIRSFGRIDTVVNNAGHAAPGTLLEQSDAALEGQWQTHVAGPLRISRAALPALRVTHGILVFVGSGLARIPAPYYGGYCAAKAAIRAAATQLRRELRGDGVAVTYVDPGAVDTEFSDASQMQRQHEGIAASPERVARAMMRGIERRARVVNAIPMHALAAMLGEFFPGLTDAAIAHVVAQPKAKLAKAKPSKAEPVKAASATPAPAKAEAPKEALWAAPFVATVPAPQPSNVDAVLEPFARRMERVRLAPTFVRSLLYEGERVELGDAAMRWAGMPNKNERAALREVLDALTQAGYLESTGAETWIVRRAAD